MPASEAFSVSSTVFGALLGLLIAYGLWFWQQRSLKRDRKQNAATVLLAELWSIDWTLRRIHDDERASVSHGSLPLQSLHEAHRIALDFPPDAVLRLLQIRGLCEDID